MNSKRKKKPVELDIQFIDTKLTKSIRKTLQETKLFITEESKVYQYLIVGTRQQYNTRTKLIDKRFMIIDMEISRYEEHLELLSKQLNERLNLINGIKMKLAVRPSADFELLLLNPLEKQKNLLEKTLNNLRYLKRLTKTTAKEVIKKCIKDQKLMHQNNNRLTERKNDNSGSLSSDQSSLVPDKITDKPIVLDNGGNYKISKCHKLLDKIDNDTTDHNKIVANFSCQNNPFIRTISHFLDDYNNITVQMGQLLSNKKRELNNWISYLPHNTAREIFTMLDLWHNIYGYLNFLDHLEEFDPKLSKRYWNPKLRGKIIDDYHYFCENILDKIIEYLKRIDEGTGPGFVSSSTKTDKFVAKLLCEAKGYRNYIANCFKTLNKRINDKIKNNNEVKALIIIDEYENNEIKYDINSSSNFDYNGIIQKGIDKVKAILSQNNDISNIKKSLEMIGSLKKIVPDNKNSDNENQNLVDNNIKKQLGHLEAILTCAYRMLVIDLKEYCYNFEGFWNNRGNTNHVEYGYFKSKRKHHHKHIIVTAIVDLIILGYIRKKNFQQLNSIIDLEIDKKKLLKNSINDHNNKASTCNRLDHLTEIAKTTRAFRGSCSRVEFFMFKSRDIIVKARTQKDVEDLEEYQRASEAEAMLNCPSF